VSFDPLRWDFQTETKTANLFRDRYWETRLGRQHYSIDLYATHTRGIKAPSGRKVYGRNSGTLILTDDHRLFFSPEKRILKPLPFVVQLGAVEARPEKNKSALACFRIAAYTEQKEYIHAELTETMFGGGIAFMELNDIFGTRDFSNSTAKVTETVAADIRLGKTRLYGLPPVHRIVCVIRTSDDEEKTKKFIAVTSPLFGRQSGFKVHWIDFEGIFKEIPLDPKSVTAGNDGSTPDELKNLKIPNVLPFDLREVLQPLGTYLKSLREQDSQIAQFLSAYDSITMRTTSEPPRNPPQDFEKSQDLKDNKAPPVEQEDLHIPHHGPSWSGLYR